MRTTRNHRLTLEPLRAYGRDALKTQGVEGIVKVTLLEIEAAWDNEFQDAVVRKADDLFGCLAAEGDPYGAIPTGGRLVQAVFLFQFTESAQPQLVRIRPPGTLEIGQNCDLASLEGWLLKRGFALSESSILDHEPSALAMS